MTRVLQAVCFFLLSIGLISPVCSQDGSSRGPRLIPFADDDEDQGVRPASVSQPRASARARGEEEQEGGFTWPSFPKPKFPAFPKPTLPKLPFITSTSSQPKQNARMMDEPSTWEKITASTKSFAIKSKHTLMPWTADEDDQRRPARRTTRSSTTSKQRSDKKPFFSSWFSPKEEEDRIETANDFLALPRVPYE